MLLTGAAGGGKSALAASRLHAFMLKYPGATGLMMRKTRQSMTNSTVLYFEREIACGTCTHVGSKNRFEYPNGSILAYGGMADDEQREQIRSIGQQGGVDMVWMEEANRFTEDDFNEILARLRGTAAPWRQVMLTTNPGAPTHWIKRRLIDQGEAHTYYSTAADNRHNPAEYASILEHMTGVAYQRLVLGQWVQAEGAVYSTWDASRMVVDDDKLREWGVIEGYASPLPVLNRKTVKRVFVGCDWGYTAPGSLLTIAVDNDNRKTVIHQVLRTGKLIDWWVQQAKEIQARYQPSAFVCDPAEPAYILQFRQAGIPCVEADNDIEAGIQSVQRCMVFDVHGRPGLAVRKGSCVDPDPVLVAAKKPTTLEEEIAGYQWQDSPDGKPVKELPVMVNDHACLVGETLVQTLAGPCELMAVQVGDYVLGRDGFVRVLAAGMTQERARLKVLTFANGVTLKGTGNHPIYVDGQGFVSIDALRYGDYSWYNCCEEKTPCRTKRQRLLSIGVSSFAGIQTPNNGATAVISPLALQRAKPASTIFTGRYTRIITAAYRPATTCITKTATRSTTRSTTLNVSSTANTCEGMASLLLQNGAPQCGSDLSGMLFRRQRHGTHRQRVRSGTGSTRQSLSLVSLNQSNELAISAASNIKPPWATIGSVPTSASQLSGVQVALTTKQGSASYAEKTSLLTATTKRPVVLLPVLEVSDGQESAPVYNLTVEGGEYYANGILVHNCDALRYVLHHLATLGAVNLPKARQRAAIA